MTNKQEHFWKSDFGKKYTDRNNWSSDEEWDSLYMDTWGTTKIDINKKTI